VLLETHQFALQIPKTYKSHEAIYMANQRRKKCTFEAHVPHPSIPKPSVALIDDANLARLRSGL
jgi:hypothetical protein